MMLPPPPSPPYPPDLERLQPHQRKAAQEAYERQMAQYEKDWAAHKRRMEEQTNSMDWLLATVMVIVGITVVAMAILFLGSAYYEFGIKGPLVLIVGCLSFAWSVCEVKKRL